MLFEKWKETASCKGFDELHGKVLEVVKSAAHGDFAACSWFIAADGSEKVEIAKRYQAIQQHSTQ